MNYNFLIVGFDLSVGMVTVGDEWLAAHSLQTLKLTAEHVLQKAKIIRFDKIIKELIALSMRCCAETRKPRTVERYSKKARQS